MSPFHKILHIDDDAVMRLMVKKSLERSSYNFEVISSSDEKECISALENFKPDLFIIDVVMPQIDGPSLLKKLRLLGHQTPAIFITGQETIEFNEPDMLYPVIGMLHKPFSPLGLGDELVKMWNKFYQ